MSQNPLHYVHEELLPHLVFLMESDPVYANWRIDRTFARAPWMQEQIGAEVEAAWEQRFGMSRAAWRERFGKVAADA